MKDEVFECLTDRCNFRDVEFSPTDNHDWVILVHAGSKSEKMGSSYTISVYKPIEADHIIIQSSASFREEIREKFNSMKNHQLVQYRRDLMMATINSGATGAPKGKEGEDSPIEYADRYTFRQYFFPEDYTPTILVTGVSRAMMLVDLAWMMPWCYPELD